MRPNNLKELKQDNGSWLDTIIYRDLGRLQVSLDKTGREKLINRLAILLDEYKQLILGVGEVRGLLYQHYNNTLQSRTSISRFSNDVNMNLKGHNNKIKNKITKIFVEASKLDVVDNGREAEKLLYKADLNYSLLFDRQILTIIKDLCPIAYSKWKEICSIRQQLFYSVIKMAVRIAKKHSLQLDGNVLEWTDLIQEALIAAMNAVDKYQPIAEGKTFTSFVYTCINGTLNKRINETARTVQIPNTTLDRYSYVVKALDSLGLSPGEFRGEKIWKQSNGGRAGKIDNETLKKIAEAATNFDPGPTSFTINEVKDFLAWMQDEVSLDMEVDSSENHGTEVVTLGDTLPDGSLLIPDQIDRVKANSTLMKIIRKYTTNEEFFIMKLRYGLGIKLEYRAVAYWYKKKTGYSMNKTLASEIDRRVIKRLKDRLLTDPELRASLKEVEDVLALSR